MHIANKTVKNYSHQEISMELPTELQESFKPDSSEMLNIKYNLDGDVPYGCLKGGVKPSYRSWIQTRKNHEHPELENLPSIRPPTPPKKNQDIFLSGATPIVTVAPETTNTISREQRLEQIKAKLKKIQEQENSVKSKNLDDFNKISNTFITQPANAIKLDELPEFDSKLTTNTSTSDISELIKNHDEKFQNQIPKKYFKKTIKRKFTLGKSDKLRKVAVLINDKQTRKNILNMQKELKKTSITDVRKYLRQHGIIKVGSTCPNDILRKTFESSLMAGEITNINKDTLIHNFLHEDT